MKKLSFIFFILHLISLLTAQRPSLRLAVYDNPPNTFMENGTARGFFVDIAADFAARFGYTVVHVNGTFPELLAKVQRGEIDLIAPIAYTHERSQFLRYSEESVVIDWSNIIVPAAADIKVIEDLRGKTLASVRNDYFYGQFKELLARQGITPARYLEFDDFEQVLSAVEASRIDAGFISHFSLNQILKTRGRPFPFKMMPGSFFWEPLYAAMPLADSLLIGQFDRYLKSVKAYKNSLYNRAFEKWYGEPYSRPLQVIAHYYPLIAFVVLILIMAFLALNLLMRKKVKYLSREMTQQKGFLQNLLQNIPAGIAILDERARVLDVNREFQKLFGLSLEQIRGELLDERIALPQQIEESRFLNSRILAGEIVDSEVIRWTHDHTPLHLHLIASPIGIESRVLGILAIYIDISERKRMEQEIIRAKNIESIGILAGGIAHDFNNMLTGILGNISLALTLVHEDKTLAILKRAEKATFKTKGLTQQLLTFSKGGTLLKRVIPLAEIVDDSVDMALSGSNIRPVISAAGCLPPVEVDETQIIQVLNNILINAKEAMPQGGEVEISLRMHEQRENTPQLTRGTYVAIAIRDHGPGLNPIDMAKLFVPFHTSKERGSGLGLAISYSIIKKHGGTISGENHLKQGAVFTVFLPASQKAPEKTERPDSSIFKKTRVLLMDDEEMVRDVFRDMLDSTGMFIRTTADSRQCIDAYLQERDKGTPFDLVFLDLTIPGDVGGIKTLENLRQIDPGVKAVAITGYSPAMFVSGELQYFRELLTKPFRLEDLLDTVSRNLS